MNKTKNSRIEYLDIVRGICITYMIAGHIDLGVRFDHYIHAFHMPLFFLFSGFFWKRTNSFKEYLKKITKKTLMPYFIWAFFFLLIDQFTFLGMKEVTLINGIKIIFTTNNNIIPIAGALWFLTAFYISNIIFTWLKEKIEKDKIIVWISVICLIIGMNLQKWTNINLWWSMNASLTGIGLMMIGYYIKKKDIMKKMIISNNLYLIVLFGIHIFIALKSGYVNMRTNIYPNIIVFIGNVIISLIVYINIAQKMENTKGLSIIKKNLILLGKESIIPLCLNQFVILVLNKYFYQNIVSFFQNSYIIIARVFIAFLAIIITTLLTRIISTSKIKLLFGK